MLTKIEERKVISKYDFYAQLMLAIRQHRKSFMAAGREFHQAFSKTIQTALENPNYEIQDACWMRMDPVFNVVHQANEMLLEAEEDLVISLLNPQLRKAQFRISAEQAREELTRLGDAAWFDSLARCFVNELPEPIEDN